MAVINTNVASLNSQRYLSQSSSALSTSLQRLSSGLRINSAKDDAAGLAISERMGAQIRGLAVAQRNANDGVSMAQTGDGALSQMGNLLQRIRELAVQSANGTNTASDRQTLNAEVTQMVSELDRFATSTQFNGLNLFDGTFSSVNYQVGANANQVVTATSTSFRTTSYGTNQVLSNNSATLASAAAVSGFTSTTGGAATVTVNGGYGSGAYTLAGTTADSAKAVAAGLNALSATGVKASAKTEFDLKLAASATNASGAYVMNVMGDNTTAAEVVTFSVTGNNADGLAAAIQAFNDKSSKTGVTARLNDAQDGITLTALDGANVSIGQGAAASGKFTIAASNGNSALGGQMSAGTMSSGAGSFTVMGEVTLDSDKTYSIVQGVAGSGLFGASAAAGATTASSLQQVANLDITTIDGANSAMRIVDSALSAVNNMRAQFGALQNRFTATISNLQTSSENLSAAQSRVRDADFAAETSAMTRAQILQQAGTAMLAQANSLPNNVLSLLRG